MGTEDREERWNRRVLPVSLPRPGSTGCSAFHITAKHSPTYSDVPRHTPAGHPETAARKRTPGSPHPFGEMWVKPCRILDKNSVACA